MENVKNIAVELRKCQREKYHHLLQRVGSLEESGENAFFYRGNVGFLLRVETLSAIISGHKILPDRIISADFKGTQAKLKRQRPLLFHHALRSPVAVDFSCGNSYFREELQRKRLKFQRCAHNIGTL